MPLIIPSNYNARLHPAETEDAIVMIKEKFQRYLSSALGLKRVTAPLFVRSGTGLNDDLNGVEPPVTFGVAGLEEKVEVVHSLAKWKRARLADYDIAPGSGIFTDMNAIRAAEEPDNLHSIYVDQWDWERVIRPEDRRVEYLYETVGKIYSAIKNTEKDVTQSYPVLNRFLPDEITFVTARELLDRHPALSPREREAEAARQYGAVFIRGIGGALSDGKPHDGRAPDYDDWTTDGGLNGDIIVWNPVLEIPFELSSMGIRVNRESLLRQLAIAGKEHYSTREFHRRLLRGELPDSIGGGIGQSRLCMLLLGKAHIGEVQVSVWPDSQTAECRRAGINLL